MPNAAVSAYGPLPVLVWVHYALLTGAGFCFALAVMYAVMALTQRPHRARRAFRAGLAGFVLALADGLGRMPIALFSAEQTGDVITIAVTTANLVFRNGIPVLVWGVALFARWRGWLADVIFATAVLIAAGITVVCYLIPV